MGIKQVRDPYLSIWQSAVDEVAAKRTSSTNILSMGSAPRRIKRPDLSNPMVNAATQIALAAEKKSSPQSPAVENVPAPPTNVNVQTLGVQEVINHCGSLAANELKSIANLFSSGDTKKITDYWNALHTKMSSCDPGWNRGLSKIFRVLQVIARKHSLPKLSAAGLVYLRSSSAGPCNRTHRHHRRLGHGPARCAKHPEANCEKVTRLCDPPGRRVLLRH